MKKFLSLLKGKAKYILGIAAIGTMLSFLISPAIGINADGPRFNFMDRDYELFRGANITNNENVWKDPVSGNAGDMINAMVYYHNGVVDTVAENTRIKVSIPSETTNGTAKLSASIMADNAPTVTNTIVDGHVVGLNGLTLNLDKDATLQLDPGSVKWYPNNYNSQNPNAPLLFGQNGSEILSANGLKIGDVKGCFEFAGFVTFRIKTTPKVTPPPVVKDISIEKTVRNVTQGGTTFVDSVNANKGDKVEFKVKVKRLSGDIDVATLSDQLPSGLTAISSSVELTKGGNTTAVNSSNFFGSGINVGPLSASVSEAIVTFEATVSSSIASSTTLTNWATLVSCGKTIKDSASVVVTINQGNAVINKSKSAFNVTQNIDATKVTANAGDVIRYTLVTSNTGDRTATFTVEDGIADILDYADVIEISNFGVQIAGPVNQGNDRQLIRYPAVEFTPSKSVTRTFTVKVKNPIPTNPQNGFAFDHKMFNIYGNAVTVLIANQIICPKPSINLTKSVRNVSRGESSFVPENRAFPGEKLEYKITFSNTGNAASRNVRVFDVLPANVTFVPDSTIIESADGVDDLDDSIIDDGILIGNLEPGESLSIRFFAQISSGVAAGEILKNTAILKFCSSELRAVAITKIDIKVVNVSTPTSLPKTGAAAGFLSLFGAVFAGANLTYFKQKKLLKTAARSAKVN